jgi:prepilin-type N-terminal cleavage/methylation domain-containing protein/prepilin-type processing-associated H-X9-DG protein
MRPAGRASVARGLQSGFTLLELLCVVSILIVLLSLVLPTLGHGRERARFAVCRGGLRQYAMAGWMYLKENNNVFPDPYLWLYSQQLYNELGGVSCMWHHPDADFADDPDAAGTLYKYFPDQELHSCPTFASVADRFGPEHLDHNPSIPFTRQYSYVMNGYFGSNAWSCCPKVSKVRSLSGVMFFAEENIWFIDGLSCWQLNNNHIIGRRPSGDKFDVDSYVPENWDACFASFHLTPLTYEDRNNGVSNAVFLDGHCETVRKEQTWELGWPLQW